MRRITISALAFFPQWLNAACNCGSADSANACHGQSIGVSVTAGRTIQFEWHFNSGGGDAYCGQFANGDYWIAPATGQSGVTITSVTGEGSGAIYVDENPQLESLGFLSKDYGNQNLDENIISSLPLNYNYSTSLVALVERDEGQYGDCGTSAIIGSCADAYNVVTILNVVPEKAGSETLRPSIDESYKELLSLSDFDFTLLPELSYIHANTLENIEEIRQRWSHSSEVFSVKTIEGQGYSEGGRAFRASLLVDDYAAGVAQAYIRDIISLFSDKNDFEEKIPAVAAMLTYGKDLYYAIYNFDVRARNWGSGAGQSLGKFPPAVIFAALSRNPLYANALSKTSSTLLGFRDNRGPQELEQINWGKNGPIWGDFPNEMTQLEVGAYWDSLRKSQCYDGATGVCNTAFGKKTSRDPHGYIDGPPNKPGSNYMSVSAGPIKGFVALAHLIPNVCQIINYPPLIQYADRITDFGVITQNDSCAPPDIRESSECDAYRSQNCLYYGLSNTGIATWGPVSVENLEQCIPNNSGGNIHQNGRFPHFHGNQINIGYPIPLVEGNWQDIRNSIHPCETETIIFADSFEG